MDFETLFTLALILLYVVAQAISGRNRMREQKQPQRQKQPGRTGSPTAEPQVRRQPEAESNELEDALREISEALGMPMPSHEPEVRREPKPRPTPAGERTQVPARQVPVPKKVKPAPIPKSRLEKSDPREIAAGRIEDAFEQRRPFEAEPLRKPAFAEERFESLGTSTEYRTPVAAPKPVKRSEAATLASRSTGHAGLIRRLRSASAAREAFVMQEILGKPRALRR